MIRALEPISLSDQLKCKLIKITFTHIEDIINDLGVEPHIVTRIGCIIIDKDASFGGNNSIHYDMSDISWNTWPSSVHHVSHTRRRSYLSRVSDPTVPQCSSVRMRM